MSSSVTSNEKSAASESIAAEADERVDVGDAKIAGLTEDLHLLVGLQYNICTAVFFVSYCVFEVPSNMVLKKVRPNLWFSMAFVKSYKQLVLAVSRFFLGVAEAGLLPVGMSVGQPFDAEGATFYFSQWYARKNYAGPVCHVPPRWPNPQPPWMESDFSPRLGFIFMPVSFFSGMGIVLLGQNIFRESQISHFG
ncbi:hypothetical protein B0H19DRAFT_1076295 [Mycena capillaripes]|nr:hypothetical protein B0H19DRAFT_1076295 [Mycena capillaripes]